MYVVRINYADGMFDAADPQNASTIFMGDDIAAAQRAFAKSECLDFRVDESWFRLTEFTVVERRALTDRLRSDLQQDLKNIAEDDGTLRNVDEQASEHKASDVVPAARRAAR